jgi:hypothetical protein
MLQQGIRKESFRNEHSLPIESEVLWNLLIVFPGYTSLIHYIILNALTHGVPASFGFAVMT